MNEEQKNDQIDFADEQIAIAKANPDGNLIRLPNPKMNTWLSLLLFFGGFIGISVIMPLLIQLITTGVLSGQGKSLEEIQTFFKTTTYSTIANSVGYTTLLISFLLVLFFQKKLKTLFKPFLKWRTYLYGISFGAIVVIFSAVYGQIIRIIAPGTPSNENQIIVEAIIRDYPLISIIIIPFFGPIVEEIIYRLGFFQGTRNINRKLAYIIVPIVFGLIHFNIPLLESGAIDTTGLVVELLNLPSYIMSGLIFCYIYEKENFATATVAHVFNNLLGVLSSLLLIGLI